HVGAAACVTWMLAEPMEMVTFCAAPVFAATTSVMVAGPIPELEPETVIQLGRPVTDHVQLAPVVSVMGKLPPAAVAEIVVTLVTKEQAPEPVTTRPRLLPVSAI